MSRFIAAVVAVFTAENNVVEKRTAAAIRYREAVEAGKLKVSELRKFNGVQAKLAGDAIVKASGLADAYAAMDDTGRAEYVKNAGKYDPLAKLITTVGSLPARISEYARVYKAFLRGDEIAVMMYAGEISLNEALTMLTRPEGKDASASASEDGEQGETSTGDLTVEQRFARTVLKYLAEGLTPEAMATIIVEQANASAKASK